MQKDRKLWAQTLTPTVTDGQLDRDTRGRFQSGNIGGPGRPKGSRNKLGEDFIQSVFEDWAAHGAAVLARVREESPSAYLRVVAGIIPSQIAVAVTDIGIDDMTEGELHEVIATNLESGGFAAAAAQLRSGKKF